MKKGFIAAVVLFSAVATGRSAVVAVAPTGSSTGSFAFTQDITFTITTGVNAEGLNFVLDEWVTSDGGSTFVAYSPGLSLSINGGAPQIYNTGNWVDNRNINIGAITPNDGYFTISSTPFTLASGDTVTIKAGSYATTLILSFNPQATQTFNGNMFVVTSSGNKVSENTAVPEPATTALLVLGGVAIFTRRRRLAVP